MIYKLNNMKYTYLFFCFLWAFSSNSLAQSEKIYFDKSGKPASQADAYYYRTITDKPGFYKSFYISDNSLYFEGQIEIADAKNEADNKYKETCTWYYKNGQKKAIRSFNNEGLEHGTSYYYFESGRIEKEIEFKNGKIVNNRYKEYSENGQVSRIFEEKFQENSNEWDLYVSDKSSAKFTGDALEINSATDEGTARFISIPIESNDFVIEAIMNFDKCPDNFRSGIIWGFKDWQNYHYFLIGKSELYIGTIYEGIKASKVDGMFTGDVKEKASNNIKILSNDGKLIFSLNGLVQYKMDYSTFFGNKMGFALSGKSTIKAEKLMVKEISFKNSASTPNNDMDVKSTGSGLIVSQNGYILTNYHVVEGSGKILIEFSFNGQEKQYTAKLIQKDIDNDLALIKIVEEDFSIDPLPYAIRESGNLDVGASVFTVGFPYALKGMGKEVKFSDGKISSKTGYNNAVNMYQTSIPVQPGNSGGPVFSDKGQLVGVINAKLRGGDNVSYIIKLNYVKNLIELLPETIPMPNNQAILNMPLEEKIKVISNYVVL